MKLLKALAPAWAMLLPLAAFSLWARTQLPDSPLPVHFDVHFQPDRWAPRDAALLLPVGVLAALLTVLSAAPWLPPPRGALERSAPAYGAVCFGVAGLITALQAAIVGQALHWPVDLRAVIGLGIGGLLMVTGAAMSKVRPNPLFGVRTPWTLANIKVWDRTHRWAAPLFMLGGLFIGLAGLTSPEHLLAAIMVGVLAPAVAAVAYSHRQWSRLPKEEKTALGGWRKRGGPSSST